MTKQYCISLFTYTIEDMVSAGNVPELYTLAWMFHRTREVYEWLKKEIINENSL